MRLTAHPRSDELEYALRACLPFLAPWTGDIFRMVEAPWANIRDLTSGQGASAFGQRWNPPGIPTLYACLDDTLAMLEWQAQRAKSGMIRTRHLPLTQVTIVASLQRVLDLRQTRVVAALGLPLVPFLTEKHAGQVDGAPEIMAQALGRIAAQLGVEALIVPAAVDHARHNLVVYWPQLPSTLEIHGKEFLPPPR